MRSAAAAPTCSGRSRRRSALDVVQARARFSESIDGIEPALTTDGTFELLDARHPLLARPVPVTIKVTPPSTVLLITGPNTGGKTVALKTAGLLALMAQAGLRIPAADGSRVPVFQSLFADIGDEQSIEASLSTFSGHIANIVSMDRSLATPALVLLDEVGSGTDPIEGGALGVAIVDHFRKRGATIIATSHYDQLKSYASTSEGVTSAAFGFHADTFAPTYQLIYGSPGRSLALEIAGRLGLNPAVVAHARANLSAREAQLADHLAKIDRDMRGLEHEHRLAAREREEVEAAAGRMRQREDALRQREETFRRRLNEELDTQVRQARREIDDVIADLKAKTAAIAQEASGRRTSRRDDRGHGRGARRCARRGGSGRRRGCWSRGTGRRTTHGAGPESGKPASNGREPKVGDRVIVGGFGLEGVVTGLHDGAAEVDVRGKRMRANVRDLSVVEAPGPGDGPRQGQCRAAAARDDAVGSERDRLQRGRSDRACGALPRRVAADRSADRPADSRLRHRPVEAGAERVSAAASAGGAVRHRPPEQGGGGVTVVELKE